MFCCASIITKEGELFSALSSKLLLPKFHQDKLKNNLYIGDYVRAYFNKDNHPATNIVAEIVRGRKPFIFESTRNVLLAYLRKDEV